MEEEAVRNQISVEEDLNKERDMAMNDVGAQECITSENTIEDQSQLDAASQTESVSTKSVGNQIGYQSLFSAQHFVTDDEGIHFYTGLQNYDKFLMVLHTLGPAVNELNYYHGAKPHIS